MISPDKQAELVLADFDGTYALTQQPAPNGMNVARAYETAVRSLFGEEGAEQYAAMGGLRNRAPSEVVDELLPGLDKDALHRKTEDLIEIKLSLLEKQVGERLSDGSIWPNIAPGFKPVWQAISEAAEISTGVISSGHTGFIERFHDVHEIDRPDIVLTDDHMRPWGQHLPLQDIVKPSPLLLEMAFMEWYWRQGHSIADITPGIMQRAGVVYIGDDPNKDGRLAENAAIDFIHVDRDNYESSWRRVGNLLIPRSNEPASE